MIDPISTWTGFEVVPATLFATCAILATLVAGRLTSHKVAACCSTVRTSWHYSQGVQLRWQALWPATVAGLPAAFASTWLSTMLMNSLLAQLPLPWTP